MQVPQMLSDVDKALIRQCMEALRDGIEGFRPRRPQLEMVAAVANTLSRCRQEQQDSGGGLGEHIAVIEAGTGTGKTFGALVPALVMARALGRRLIVSSSTVALQHQYAQKDVPALQAVLPIDFTFAVAKGRRRYACTAKLMAQAANAGQEDLELDDHRSGSPAKAAEVHEVLRRRRIFIGLAEAFEGRRWNGDRDELAVPVVDELWNQLTTDRHGCAGNRCPEFGRCPFYAARQQVKSADLVIANHDLVLSALEMQAGSVLPPACETFYVLDEAHSLAAKAVEHFSARHAIRGTQEWLESATEAVRDAVLALRLDGGLLGGTRDQSSRIDQALGELYRRIHATRAFEEKKARRFRTGELPEWVERLGGAVHSAASDLQNTFATLREAVLERASFEGALATQVLSTLGFFAARLDNLVDTWSLVLAEVVEGEAPVARWIELHGSASSSSDYLVCASPISGSDKLRQLLWNRASGVILMSATLTSCGSFHLFLQQTGLSVYAGVQFLGVESPFDYRSNARLVIPAMRTDPADAQAHTVEVVERMPGLVQTLGTLVLFASGKQMREVYALLPEDLRRCTLMQGTMPKMEMLSRHRATIDCGERSVLFGLQSFAEGVDLPREYCTHLVCSRLPFAVPGTPLEEARCEWIESQGRSPFIEITVPETAVRFKQLLGRLIRTDEDHGTATILDRRLVSRRWGRLLKRGLPDFELVVEPASRRSAARRGVD
jgi:ATP-dependent DNA helicase DinG